ncbi:MAG: hypothetical protein NTZ01_01825 [Verrucomicrobia bacterium]|nr:hypothetical protein [Verrucomicrobiota bacterium]
MNILIINHYEVPAKVIGRIAEQSGWHVLIVEGMGDLPNLLKQNEIDLLVCDLIPPAESKEEVSRITRIEELRKAGVNTPVFLLEEEKAEVPLDPKWADRLGGVNLFQKPVSIRQMRQGLNEVRTRAVREKYSLKTCQDAMRAALNKPVLNKGRAVS